jgi:flagellar biosynthesis/type III secretory pathway protein FliH
MPLTRAQAKEITTAAEFGLVEASYAPAVKKLNRAQLKQKAERARRLQEKYRDLARRQKREGKEAGRRGAAMRTDRKARLFAEVRERFERRLEAAESGVVPGA